MLSLIVFLILLVSELQKVTFFVSLVTLKLLYLYQYWYSPWS